MTENPWIEHDGGPEDFDPFGRDDVEVEYRSGVTSVAHCDHFSWSHDGGQADIVRYRRYRLTGPSA